MRKQSTIILAAFILTCSLSSSAMAVKQFQTEFYRLYDIDPKAEKPNAFAKTFLEAKCFLCHKGKKKKNRNAFGQELGKLLNRKKDAKNPEKITEAIKKVVKLHTDAKDKKSPTYGALIKAGKLPGGPLKEAMKDPVEKKTDGDKASQDPAAKEGTGKTGT